MGADLAYIGSPFIATHEANAAQSYKDMIVASGADDIVNSNAFTGVHGNYLAASITAAGIDLGKLGELKPVAMDFAARDENGQREAKAWRDIWGSGQGIGAVTEIVPAGALVDRLAREYAAADAPRLPLRAARTGETGSAA